MSPAALRAPELVVAFPCGPEQSVAPDDARRALEDRLAVGACRPVLLSVTDNRRNMITYSNRDGLLRARIHHMFLDAPATVHDALIDYVVRGDRSASRVVGRYIDDNGHRIRASRPAPTPLTTRGRVHDLCAVYQQINERYFGGAVDALITWGKERRSRRRRPRRSIKLGSYSAIERLIRVHPALDRPWVPRYFLAYIVYHEMLHHVIPSSHDGNRRTLHPPLFHRRERLFRDFDRALAWERSHVGRLLRS